MLGLPYKFTLVEVLAAALIFLGGLLGLWILPLMQGVKP